MTSQTPALPDLHHSRFDDIQGLAAGTALTVIGVYLLQAAGLVTGGMAGLAVLASYLTGWSFGLLFFLFNLPFYWLAWKRRGPGFMVKTLLVIAAVSLGVDLLPSYVTISAIHPVAAALGFGFVGGVGLLAVFRHGASMGGVGIMALILQDRTGFRAGWTQLAFDSMIFLAAFFILPPGKVLLSLLGVTVLNLVIAFNHRRDWYLPH